MVDQTRIFLASSGCRVIEAGPLLWSMVPREGGQGGRAGAWTSGPVCVGGGGWGNASLNDCAQRQNGTERKRKRERGQHPVCSETQIKKKGRGKAIGKRKRVRRDRNRVTERESPRESE